MTGPGAPLTGLAVPARMPPKPSPSHQTASDHATDAASASLRVGRQAMPRPRASWMVAKIAFSTTTWWSMRLADQVMGPATTAGLPCALSASMPGKLLVNIDGWYCRMPSSTQMTPRASWSWRHGSSAAMPPASAVAAVAARPVAGRAGTWPTARLSLMWCPPFRGSNTTVKDDLRIGQENGRIAGLNTPFRNPGRVLDKPRTGIKINPARVSSEFRLPHHSAGERRVAAADRRDPALGLLPVLLAAERRHVQVGIGVPDVLGAPGEGRIGVEDLVALAQEAAVAGHLGGAVAAEQARFGPVVVLGLAAVGVQADLVVVVEVAAVGGVPRGDGPAAFGRRRGDLAVRGAGGQHERGVPGGDVLQHARGELVDRGRAARAGLVPVRAEHHVLNDQLPLAAEQLGQRDRPVRALEDVLLVHLDHGQPAPVGVERVVGAGELLLARQQSAPGLEPLLPGDDIGKTHRETSCE